MRANCLRCILAALLFLAGASDGRAQATSESGGTLNVLSFGGKLDEAFKDAFKDFAEQHKVTIRWLPFGSSTNLARALATKDSPEYDVILLENMTDFAASARGLLAQIDEKIVTNYKDLYPEAKLGNHDSVAFGFFSMGFFYAPDEFAKLGWAPPTKWSDLLRPEFCNHIGFMHPQVSYGTYAIMMLGGPDPTKMPAAIEKFATLKNCIPTLEPTAAKMQEKIQLKEYLVGVESSIAAIPLVAEKFPIKFVLPSDYTVAGASTVAVVKGAPHERLAQEFVNHFISPEVQKKIIESVFYAPANSTVEVPASMHDLGVLGVQDRKLLVKVDEAMVAANRQRWIAATERAMSH